MKCDFAIIDHSRVIVKLIKSEFYHEYMNCYMITITIYTKIKIYRNQFNLILKVCY